MIDARCGEPLDVPALAGAAHLSPAHFSREALSFYRDTLGSRSARTSPCPRWSRGVEFTSEPTRMPYGIDAPFRDPFGNEFRMVQVLDESEG